MSFDHADGMVAVFHTGAWDMMVVGIGLSVSCCCGTVGIWSQGQ